MSLPNKYTITEREAYWQSFWEKHSIYSFDASSPKPVFSVDTPPPYVSADHLHPGHIMSYSQAEFVVRFKRMQGYNVFYPMGFDDNGLPTERHVEKKHKIKNKNAISRSDFIKLCLEETQKGAQTYQNLWKLMGISTDWDKTYSTINPNSQRVSQWSFLDLYRKQKIYQDEKPIMWCTQCETALAQADLDDAEKPSNLVHINVSSDKGSTITFATTRPELLPSCVGMSVHPDDSRYQQYIGQTFSMPITGAKIELTSDEMVDPQYGTGVVYFCSSGDNQYLDWEIRHPIEEKIYILEPNGRFNEKAGPYEGMTISQTRKQIVKDLEACGVLEKVEAITHTVKVHERCGTDIEYMVSKQWFINVMDHKDELLAQGEKLNWNPSRMFQIYQDWVTSLKWDWCISRQRYYGVPLPVWYHKETGEVILPNEDELPVDPTEYTPRGYNKEDLIPETDVMDTWMTSSVSPIIGATLGDPTTTLDTITNSNLYPTSLRPQAFEIIRTWLFYTVTKSLYHHNTLPFTDVMISGHGLDAKGKKISKRLGNYTPPEHIIEQYGADALRFWATGTTLGENIRYNEDEVKKGKKTTTKLFNAARFLEMHLSDFDATQKVTLEPADTWVLDQLNQTIVEATADFEAYEYFKARTAIDTFFWNVVTDNYLEFVKYRLYDETPEGQPSRNAAQYTVYQVLLGIIKMYAPILPFITEEIYQGLFRKTEGQISIHTSSWPTENPEWILTEDTRQEFAQVLSLVEAVRGYKSTNGISLGKEIERFEYQGSESLKEYLPFLQKALRVAEIILIP